MENERKIISYNEIVKLFFKGNDYKEKVRYDEKSWKVDNLLDLDELVRITRDEKKKKE